MVEKLSAYGDSIIIFCPRAAWPHLAGAGTSTMFAAGPAVQFSIVSFGNLLCRVTLIGGRFLSPLAWKVVCSYRTTADGFCSSF